MEINPDTDQEIEQETTEQILQEDRKFQETRNQETDSWTTNSDSEWEWKQDFAESWFKPISTNIPFDPDPLRINETH